MIEEYFSHFGITFGVLIIVGIGLVFFLIVAFLLELRTRKMFPERVKSDDDFDLFSFDDDEEDDDEGKAK